jgi:hypothetical protein
MTASQIVEMARKTVSVKIRVGPPPGLPEKYKMPLGSASEGTNNSIAVPSLVGSGWDLTSNMNGSISHDHVLLGDGGVLDDGAGHPGHREQRGARTARRSD